jgi:hypothetical protein
MNDLKLSLILLTAPFVMLAALAEFGLDLARYRELKGLASN